MVPIIRMLNTGWMWKICEKYPYNAGPARGAISVRPCVNTENPTHVLKQHEKSGRHQRLEKKLYKSENELKETLQRTELSLVEKAKMNTYITKCIHTIHYLQKYCSQHKLRGLDQIFCYGVTGAYH